MEAGTESQTFYRSLFANARGWLKLLVLLLGFLCFLGGLWWFYCQMENRHGRAVWAATRAELEAKGETFDWAALRPAPVPDAENFAGEPFLEAIAYRDLAGFAESQRLASRDAGPLTQFLPDQKDQRLPSLAAMARTIGHINVPSKPAFDTNLAPLVIDWFAPLTNDFAALMQASHRPFTRYRSNPTNAFEVSLNFVRLRQLCQQLAVFASAQLAAGESRPALDAIRVNFAVSRGMESGGTLVASMIGVAIDRLTIGPIWQGLASHAWNDGELAELDELLEPIDLLASVQNGMRGERASVAHVFTNLQAAAVVIFSVPPAKPDPVARLAKIAAPYLPVGWGYQARALHARAVQEYLIDPYDRTQRRFNPAVAAGATNLTERLRASAHPREKFASLVIPNFVRAMETAALAQVQIDQARLAIALERHRLRHGQLPEQLFELVPEFLPSIPNDLLADRPIQYRRLTDDLCMLWSVGLNGVDEEGAVAETDSKGDWVWFNFAPN